MCCFPSFPSSFLRFYLYVSELQLKEREFSHFCNFHCCYETRIFWKLKQIVPSTALHDRTSAWPTHGITIWLVSVRGGRGRCAHAWDIFYVLQRERTRQPATVGEHWENTTAHKFSYLCASSKDRFHSFASRQGFLHGPVPIVAVLSSVVSKLSDCINFEISMLLKQLASMGLAEIFLKLMRLTVANRNGSSGQ